MEFRQLTSGVVAVDTTSIETDSVSTSANSLVLMFVTNAVPQQGRTPGLPIILGPQAGWAVVKTVTFGVGNDRRLTCLRTMSSTDTSGPLVIDFEGELQDYCAWSIVEYLGAHTGGTLGSGAIEDSGVSSTRGGALSTTLAAAIEPARSASIGGMAIEVIGNPPAEVIQGKRFREIHEQRIVQFGQKAALFQTQESSSATTTVNWSWAGDLAAAGLAVLVRPVPLPIDVGPSQPVLSPADEALIKRFEPVLFLHPAEEFFPVDAKRFVENSALWRAREPFDAKESWGGIPGDPYPRKPVVEATKLSATSTESGEFRFGEPLGKGLDNRFLELGGWKDRDDVPEAAVTVESTNVYANRDAIAARYRTDLADGQFWYHAEIFDNARLTRLAARDPDLSLVKVLARHPDWKLLCYYFFFPAHEQTVGNGTCTTVESREVACHAGDWQCMAIMLTASAGSYTPKFLGHTGSRPATIDVDGHPTYRPFAFDDDGFTAMKVEPWREAQPMTTDGHPRLFVALGSHSLYTSAGDHAVDPYAAGQEPQKCGVLDSPGLIPVVTVFPAWMGAILAKWSGGGFLGPIGAAIGIVAGVLELVSPPSVPNGAVPADRPRPDSAPTAPGVGKTITPRGLTVPDGGADVVEWRSQRKLMIGARSYDCVVDRETQPWWPNDDGRRGFWGRWGQHVTTNPLTRRAGPLFPDYVAMFLSALEYGNNLDMLDLDA